MPEIRSKNSKVKTTMTPAYSPKLFREPTEEANVPLWQSDGLIRYASQKDLQWLYENGKLEIPD